MDNPRLGNIQQRAVSDFGKYLIFYRVTLTGIDIVRVLHGARDIDRILDEGTFPE